MPGEAELINPGRWGRSLAEFLRHKLSERGIATGEMNFEDWGVVIPIDNAAFPIWIGCGNYEECPDSFLCLIEPSKAKIWRGFHRVDTTQDVGRLAETIDSILVAEPQIRDVRWWTKANKAREPTT